MLRSTKQKIISGGAAGLVLALLFFVYSSDDDQVGNVSLGLLTLKDIKIERLEDPKISGVTCFLAHVEGNFDFVDPSNTSIACRQTGEISLDQINSIDKSESGEVVFKSSQSIFFKTLKIRRLFDLEAKTLIYLSYSTTEIEEAFEHSLSTVPLYGNPVWTQLNQPLTVRKE